MRLCEPMARAMSIGIWHMLDSDQDHPASTTNNLAAPERKVL